MSDIEDLPSNIEAKKFFYRGSSMQATFSQGQVLYVKPKVNKIQPGDVIVYKNGKEFIVHRVNAVSPSGFQTRGDNNFRSDDFELDEEQIIGIVESVDDGKKNRPVIGGRRGLYLARVRWGLTSVFNWMLPVIGAPYRYLKTSRIFAKVWHPHVIQIKTVSSSGQMIKYIVGGKTVATWIPDFKRFKCKRLYDLVIFPPD